MILINNYEEFINNVEYIISEQDDGINNCSNIKISSYEFCGYNNIYDWRGIK